jgi:hypothetical protein
LTALFTNQATKTNTNQNKSKPKMVAVAKSSKSKTSSKLSRNFSAKLAKVSNWRAVQRKAFTWLGRNHGKLYVSPNKTKKYCVVTPTGRIVSFGAINYEDFTKHRDKERRKSYLSRSTKIKGNWKKNKFSPNNLAIHLLW